MDALDIGSAIVPLEEKSGDLVIVKSYDNVNTLFCLIDIAGHGNTANELGLSCEKLLSELPFDTTESLMNKLHQHLHGTRGGVAFIGIANEAHKTIQFSVVGNLFVRSISDQVKSIPTNPGVLGNSMRHITTHNVSETLH